MNCTSYDECVEQYNQEISRLWKTKFHNAIKLTEKTNVEFKQFCFHANQVESPIWFFGMNPSLPKPTKEFISQTTPPDKNLIEKLEKEQKNMHKKIQYFNRAIEFFINEVKIPELRKPIFHDLYPVRHTQQKEFEKFREDNKKGFCKSLDDATKKLIDKIMPDIIVIANAGASRLIKEIFFEGIDSNSTTLTYEQNGKKTDMIFSSMLSGQRALDTYSRSRLAREIRETWNSRIK